MRYGENETNTLVRTGTRSKSRKSLRRGVRRSRLTSYKRSGLGRKQVTSSSLVVFSVVNVVWTTVCRGFVVTCAYCENNRLQRAFRPHSARRFLSLSALTLSNIASDNPKKPEAPSSVMWAVRGAFRTRDVRNPGKREKRSNVSTRSFRRCQTVVEVFTTPFEKKIREKDESSRKSRPWPRPFGSGYAKNFNKVKEKTSFQAKT